MVPSIGTELIFPPVAPDGMNPRGRDPERPHGRWRDGARNADVVQREPRVRMTAMDKVKGLEALPQEGGGPLEYPWGGIAR